MTTKALTISKYRGSITRLLQSLSTLRGLGRPSTPQDSLLADDQSLPGRIGYLQDHIERFQFFSSPFPRLAWRDTTIDNNSEEHSLLLPEKQLLELTLLYFFGKQEDDLLKDFILILIGEAL